MESQLEEERKKCEVMEARLLSNQKMLKQGLMALVSHMQSSKTGLPAVLFDMIANLNDSDETSPKSLMDDTMDEHA
ncbi:uncharacterized protein [Nicotiana tomentosiformis]|uniref:uncharacterized protein isoform X2 n=1 Tax=Nicotiana tomentosiformis TaxID=4098 RepID=UPI00388C5555